MFIQDMGDFTNVNVNLICDLKASILFNGLHIA